MKISSLFIIVLSWSHSLVYAGESPSKSEPTLWEKAKTIGSEVLQGKFDTSNSKNDSNHVEEEADREKGKMKPEVRDSEKNRAMPTACAPDYGRRVRARATAQRSGASGGFVVWSTVLQRPDQAIRRHRGHKR